jgi:dimethylargininase
MLIALTREVSSSIADCQLTHLARVPIDVDRARAEHAAYERALEQLGCTITRLAAAADMPDAVFIEDTALVLDEVAVITRPGAESRRAETRAVAQTLREWRPVVEITAPARLDGGDVVRIGRRLFVGVGPRSNDRAVEQLGQLLAPFGYTVHGVEFRGCLHLKTAATLIAEDLLLINPEWVTPATFVGAQTLAIDHAEPYAANALMLGDRVIHGDSFHRTRRKLESAGVTVVPVPAGELAKAEGGVTCCCLLIHTPDQLR